MPRVHTDAHRETLQERMKSTHQELLDKRVRLGMKMGVPLYAANSIEAWFDFRDWNAVAIQLCTAFVMLCLMGLSYTGWGARRKLIIFTLGFLIAVAGFEVIVCHENAFGTSYSDGFPTLYAFYCVLIPTCVRRTALVGMAAMLLLAVPEALITGAIGRLVGALIANATSFGVLLWGRHIANTLWASEFRVSRLHSDFVQSVTHEFLTPLTPLRVLTEGLAAGHVSDEKERSEVYGVLAREAKRLQRLIEGLLEFGRMEAGIIDYHFENIDPAELATEVVRDFSDYDSNRARRIELHVSEETPLVCGDKTTLTRVLWNLIENAVKYSPEGSAVLVDVGRQKGFAILRVRDSGIGIQDSELPYIFDKYVRGEAAIKSGVRGKGIGLSIVNRIVKAHSGHVEVESTGERGTTFTVFLPAVVTHR